MSEAFAFGPFRLLVARRELLAHGVPVTLGQRAFEILLTLVSRHGQLVTKDELMAEVWPGVVVEENNIQVHISAVRKVLAAAGDGERYLLTVAGRGYRFVAPITREGAAEDKPAQARDRRASVSDATSAAINNLPQQLTSLIGREADLAEIKARLSSHRLVTLTGSGGVGKTRLSIEAGRSLLDHYPDGVWLAELAPLKDAQLVTSIVGDVLGVSLSASAGALDTLVSALRTKHLLLIIDNCEHVIGEAARVAEALMRGCPRLSILASSRERLAIAGESIIRVPSLPAPQPSEGLTAADARDYGAVRLFVERANALGCGFALSDANAGTVASICRRLDGIPLAIELAAARGGVLGISEVAARLDDRFNLLSGGHRTALPRHQTLLATLDWSHHLLPEPERVVLRRLAIFAGAFTLTAASTVAASGKIASADVVDGVANLVAKSLVRVDAGTGPTQYRLLETTRAYALEKLSAERRGRPDRAPPRRVLPRPFRAGRSRMGDAPNRRFAGGLRLPHR